MNLSEREKSVPKDSQESLPGGFYPEDQERIKSFLEKFSQHVDLQRYLFVGRLSNAFSFADKGIAYPPRPFNDLDALIEKPDSLPPSITADFLIAHYHLNPRKVEDEFAFYFELVEPETKIKIDLFAQGLYSPQACFSVNYGGFSLNLQSPEDQVTTALLEVQSVLKGGTIEPKRVRDITLLMSTVDIKQAERFYERKKRGKTNFPNLTLTEVYQAIKAKIEAEPKLIVEKLHNKTPYHCEDCVSVPGFEITPMEEIYRILGNVD